MATPNPPASPVGIHHLRTPPNTMNFRNRQICLLANHFQNPDIQARILAQGTFFHSTGPTIIYCKIMVPATDPEIAFVGIAELFNSIPTVQIVLTTHRDLMAPPQSACKLEVSLGCHDHSGVIIDTFSLSFKIIIPLVRPGVEFVGFPMAPETDGWDGPKGIIRKLQQFFKIIYTCEGVERTNGEKVRVKNGLM